MSNPKYEEAVNVGRSTYRIPRYINNFKIVNDNEILIPRGIRKSFLKEVVAGKHEFKVVDQRKKFEFIELKSDFIKYRPYQYTGVLELISNGPEGMLVAPAGSGKTVIGLSLIPLLGQPTLWLTHTKPLATQAIDRAHTFLPSLKEEDIGMIGGGKWNKGKIFTVGIIQTFSRRVDTLHELRDDFGLVIVDEAHHAPASTFLQVIGELNPYYLYGLTATPYRRDKLEKVMFQVMGTQSAVITIDEVEKHGGIVRPIVKYRTVPSKVITDNNSARLLAALIKNDKRNRMIVSDVISEAVTGHYCIVVSDRKAHCETLYDLIQAGWDKTGIATGDYSYKEQQEQVQRFYDGKITVLVTTFALLGEGFDVDFLDRAFVTTPFRNRARLEQLIGRIQRVAKGKENAIVYDYVDADIGVFKDQFYSPGNKDCRFNTYQGLGVEIVPY